MTEPQYHESPKLRWRESDAGRTLQQFWQRWVFSVEVGHMVPTGEGEWRDVPVVTECEANHD